ncbi:copper chaperone PCu(A)C [Roseicitreum antarcticum]|uniref:Copper(I)-binding protein n=1 Tax=Roseicitreum antarcticum TaxID=564137 RepID=A0A1H2RHG4_9RHOB|nr:copper chaperone PCu(A)C [Roseicitreum antarcticum]SDW18735.1 hypothetical protein SAMN04488238_101314 [Roseicitreum antarcticum]
MLRSALLAASAALLALPALAHDGFALRDPYMRVSTPMAQSGAAFMVIENHRDVDDRLIGARSDAAERVELHSHIEDANGVMRMTELEDGIALPAGGEHAMARGGDHVMFMGLTESLSHGDVVNVTLVFETFGEVSFDIPVDLERTPDAPTMQPEAMHSGGHSGHN